MTDIRDCIFRLISAEDGDNTASAGNLGALLADALELVGVFVDGEQIADFVRELGNRTELTAGEIADRLAEDIEADLDDEGV